MRKNMKLKDNTVLITGGGSGIGLALAKTLVDKGNTVLICGRNETKLEAAKRFLPKLHTFKCDVSDVTDRERLLAHIEAEFPKLNVLVNNAGMMQELNLINGKIDSKKIAQEININFLAPIELTQLLLPLLRKQEKVAIINVSSGLAYVPMATSPVYCASKAALHSYTQSLREQLKGSSVSVFEILPPAVDTVMIKEVNTSKLNPDNFAKRALRALERGQQEIRIGQTKALYAMSRIAPRFIYVVLNSNSH